MYNPQSTYRIQFHKEFKFLHLKQIIPYLHKLGVKTIYASPIFEAVPGSTHGYDGIDPNNINPEIGTREELYEISKQLQTLGMGWIQDFVPNHMAFAPQNKWLCDYLEKGKMSAYNNYFDKNPDEPLMAPLLGTTLDEAIQNQDVSIVYRNGKLQVMYFEILYPLNYSAYVDILNDEMLDDQGFDEIRALLDQLEQCTEQISFNALWNEMLKSLADKCSIDFVAERFNTSLQNMRAVPGWTKQLLDTQFFRLCYWKETNTKINYRRFFTINGLICMNIQHEEVFNDYHRLLSELLTDGVVQGIRIDHIDGLYDPEQYLQRLRKLSGPETYIVVEKILEWHEHLPEQWPVQGTTGYDFLAQVNNVLTNTHAEQAFEDAYHKLSPDTSSLNEQIHFYKEMILNNYMQGELNNLVSQFLVPTRQYLAQVNIEEREVKTIIAEMLICSPVYRYYPGALPFSHEDMQQFNELTALVLRRNISYKNVLDHFTACFTDKHLMRDLEYRKLMLHFWRRFMQLSGPLMAKGIEDTLIYNHHRFIGHNEVGDSPSFFGIKVNEFHELMKQRANHSPLSMNATATHDTKRGEDSRARLQWLSGNAKDWFEHVKVWLGGTGRNSFGLSLADQYFVLQAVFAALDISEKDTGHTFTDRLKAFLIKAAREAKSKSSWDEPNEDYEKALFSFANHLSDPKSRTGKDLRKFLLKNAEALGTASLSQLALKCLCPGIPDVYQGTELQDLSFVDPDNRQAVDYSSRKDLLEKISDEDFNLHLLLQRRGDPALKLFCLQKLLKLRNDLPELFSKGSYEAVNLGQQYLSFIRSFGNDSVLVIIPLPDPEISNDPPDPLPMHVPELWTNILSGNLVKSTDLDLKHELKQLPFLVLKAEVSKTKRSAGILLPLFSLPTAYGIGDMGKSAFDFIRFLKRSGQKVWQILPLNPILEENHFSPYACCSAFAGEPMYIDLQQLKENGLLEDSDLIAIELPATRKVDYQVVAGNKLSALNKAWNQFKSSSYGIQKQQFKDFCKTENHWLDDYVLYASIRKQHNEKPWYEWPQPLRDRAPEAIDEYKTNHADDLEFQRWTQFIFFSQWKKLKAYATVHNVQLIGDIPFYMSNDSADVWSNRSLFNVGHKGDIKSIAGVPPDYFSATGQLWGMPTYHWAEHKKDDYRWWIARLRQNVRLFDLVRLDHFRAFYDYWEIPAGAENAIHGTWKNGPQDDLFNEIKRHFPEMPFIAEDLGEIHQGVFDFIDQYKLPGMRVLQFGFDDYNGTLRDLPHNYKSNAIAYTGTHDNNTVVGWFKELKPAAVEALSNYVGYTVTLKNVAACMIQLACQSVAQNVIIPMQDILGLDEQHRINTPSTIEHNWKWRMLPNEIIEATEAVLLQYTRRYNR